MAAHRAGVKCVVFPAKNKADLSEIPEDIKKELEIITVNELEEIVDLVLRPVESSGAATPSGV